MNEMKKVHSLLLKIEPALTIVIIVKLYLSLSLSLLATIFTSKSKSCVGEYNFAKNVV